MYTIFHEIFSKVQSIEKKLYIKVKNTIFFDAFLEDFKIEEQGCCVKSGSISLVTTHRGFLRKMLGMKATIKFRGA